METFLPGDFLHFLCVKKTTILECNIDCWVFIVVFLLLCFYSLSTSLTNNSTGDDCCVWLQIL